MRMLAGAASLLLVLGLGQGCWEEPPRASPPPTPTPAGCSVMFHVTVEPKGPRERTLSVTLENTTVAPIAFDLADRCPNGLVDFDGLGPGYDYYGTCAAGACASIGSPRHIALGARQRVPLAETTIDTGGKGSCTHALAPGRYVLRAVVPPLPVAGCSDETLLEVAGQGPLVVAPAPSPPARPAPPSERPSAVAPGDPYACSSPTDCVLSCPEPKGCCGWPCGCKNAVNRRARAAFEASYASTCERPPNCPAVGCSFEPAAGATCRNGRCVATTGPGM